MKKLVSLMAFFALIATCPSFTQAATAKYRVTALATTSLVTHHDPVIERNDALTNINCTYQLLAPTAEMKKAEVQYTASPTLSPQWQQQASLQLLQQPGIQKKDALPPDVSSITTLKTDPAGDTPPDTNQCTNLTMPPVDTALNLVQQNK